MSCGAWAAFLHRHWGHPLQDVLVGGKSGFHPPVGNSSVPQGAARSARKLEQLGKTLRLVSLKKPLFSSNCKCSFVH